MAKTVLIARSHTFIVSVMKPFLEELGYGTRRLEHIGELASLSRGAMAARPSDSAPFPIAGSVMKNWPWLAEGEWVWRWKEAATAEETR